MTGHVVAGGLSTDAAWEIARRALEKGRSLGLRISVAVVDGGGHRLAFARENGAPWTTVGVAEDKAFTAVGHGRSTAELARMLSSAPDHLRAVLTQRPRFLPLGGGLPIRIDGAAGGLSDGVVLGGIGVSGGSEEQDEACALAGVAAAPTTDR